MERLPEELNNQIFKKLKSIVDIERMSANERLEYELSLAAERDMLAALDAKFEDGEMKGKEEGLSEGIAIGKEEGIAIGKREGVTEGRETATSQIAHKMKQAGRSVSEIIEFTGLTAEEIEEL